MKRILRVFIITAFMLFASNVVFSMVQVGEEVTQRFETPHPYAKTEGVVWEKEFHWPGAGYIAIHFSEFNLATGDYVEISSPDGRFYYTFSEKGKKVKHRDGTESISTFWATHIPGDKAIVRLVSKNKESDHGFVIDKWAHGYERDYIEAVMAGLEEEDMFEAICNNDDKEWAKCYEGTEMYNKARAVCRLLIDGTGACTGWLLGSEGHVMTNNHCISTQSSANNTDYEFMAEGATCATSCASWGACPGTVEANSGTLIQTDFDLDYTLILLPTNLTGTYGYLQFRDTLPSLDERIYIPQHPAAWGKQLAVNSDTDGPVARIYSTNEPPCFGGPGDIGYYADTAGGSSGSPVLGYNDNLVVALHHCADCPNRGVPIPPIITDLGTNIPANAIGSPGPPQPPVANFSGNPTTVVVGSSVQFIDLSTNIPTSWAWTFAGGTPATSTDQHPTVTYNTPGTFDVTLVATNAQGSDSETKVDYITVTSAIYCSSQGNIQDDEYIGGVNVADLNNNSGPSPYSDFTSMTANMTAGATVDVTLTPVHTGTSFTEYWRIWIDYNKDGDFEDAGEEVFSDDGDTVITGSFTVQSGMDVVTRMRVSMKYGSYPTPCETFTWGEVEDYTVNISKSGPDFNNDGQTDIVWRYYGTGGYNAVWLRGTATTTASVTGISPEKINNNPGVVDMGNVKPIEETGEVAAKVETAMSISIQELRKLGIKDGFEEYNIAEVDHSKPLIDPFDFYMKKGKSGEAVSRIMEAVVSDPRDDPEAVELPAAVNLDWKLCGTGDFNSDGSVDLVWRNLWDGRNLVWYLDGVTLTGTEFLPSAVNMDWALCGTGDFNSDGSVDLVWRNLWDGRNLVWYLDGVTLTGAEYLPTAVNMDWTLCGTGDFNSDGKVDLVWRNLIDGRNLVWYLDGVTLTGVDFLPSAINMDWTLCGSGDFDNDGKVDLLWRNLSNGGNLLWYLDGVTLTGIESLTTVTNTTWRIEN